MLFSLGLVSFTQHNYFGFIQVFLFLCFIYRGIKTLNNSYVFNLILALDSVQSSNSSSVTDCVPRGESLNLSKAQFSHL